MQEGERIRCLKHRYGNRVGWGGATRRMKGGDSLASEDGGPAEMMVHRAQRGKRKWREMGKFKR